VGVSAAEPNSVLIRNVTVHPVTAPEMPNSSVLVIDGKIADIGPHLAAHQGARVIDGRGLHLYPGIINAATNVGLAEVESLRDTIDLDEIGTFNPELRAEVAFNPSSEHVEVTRASGITSVITLPGSGARGGRAGGGGSVITGQGALMHMDGWTWEEMAVRRGAVMEMVFPQLSSGGGRAAGLCGAACRRQCHFLCGAGEAVQGTLRAHQRLLSRGAPLRGKRKKRPARLPDRSSHGGDAAGD
jgi:hypothetical protein